MTGGLRDNEAIWILDLRDEIVARPELDGGLVSERPDDRLRILQHCGLRACGREIVLELAIGVDVQPSTVWRIGGDIPAVVWKEANVLRAADRDGFIAASKS